MKRIQSGRGPFKLPLPRVLMLLAMFFVASISQAAQYTFAVEPLYPADRAEQIYKPLLSYLSQSTGEQFTLITAKNYHFYWRDIRAGAANDFAFDEAHLADYRINHYHYEPLVRTAEATGYSLVANPDIASKGMAGLIEHRIATMPAPSLGYAVLLSLYPDPLQQPNIQSTATSWRDAVDLLFSGEVDAAIVPNILRDQYPNLTSMKSSRDFPGATVTAAATVPAEVKQKVKDALLKLQENPDLYAILNQIGITKFTPADPTEYRGSELMLKDFYGYQ